MYYDPIEHVERDPAPAVERGRMQRDIVGLAVMVVGGLCVLIGAFTWSTPAGIALTGAYLMAGGWFVASGRSN
ncbi:hypothetical protein ACWCSD_48395 [Nonomuraea sp. NPDC001684]